MVIELLTLVKRRRGPYYLAAGLAVWNAAPDLQGRPKNKALGRARFRTIIYIINRTDRWPR